MCPPARGGWSQACRGVRFFPVLQLSTGIEENLEMLRVSLYGTDDKSPKIENIQKLKDNLVKKKHELFKADFVEGSDDTSLLIRLLEDLELMTLKVLMDCVNAS